MSFTLSHLEPLGPADPVHGEDPHDGEDDEEGDTSGVAPAWHQPEQAGLGGQQEINLREVVC